MAYTLPSRVRGCVGAIVFRFWVDQEDQENGLDEIVLYLRR